MNIAYRCATTLWLHYVCDAILCCSVCQFPMKHRDASVQIKDDWPVVEELDFPRLSKLNLPDIKEPEDL